MNFENLAIGYENLILLRFLITNQKEDDLFILSFWKGEETQSFTILKYHLYRIRELNMSIDTFKSFFLQDVGYYCKKEGLETLFMQPVNEIITNAILNKISRGYITLEHIYKTFQEHVSRNEVLNIVRLAKDNNRERQRRFI